MVGETCKGCCKTRELADGSVVRSGSAVDVEPCFEGRHHGPPPDSVLPPTEGHRLCCCRLPHELRSILPLQGNGSVAAAKLEKSLGDAASSPVPCIYPVQQQHGTWFGILLLGSCLTWKNKLAGKSWHRCLWCPGDGGRWTDWTPRQTCSVPAWPGRCLAPFGDPSKSSHSAPDSGVQVHRTHSTATTAKHNAGWAVSHVLCSMCCCKPLSRRINIQLSSHLVSKSHVGRITPT
jgi:hypothetical protein